jgi:ABC-type antimicrobial peptide transport system permease subunit
MIKNFFKIAFRNIKRHKVSTFINVTGLAIGLAASLLILLWVQNELSFDQFNKNCKNIYRVEEDQFYSGERYHVTVTPHPSGPVWKQKIPEIKEQTRINRLHRLLFRQGDKVFFESAIIAADSGIFRMFTMPFIVGDPDKALASPHSIVLTERLAKKYFGDENPLGKSITLENKTPYTVTGVMKNTPNSSSFTFDGIISYHLLGEIGISVYDNWGSNSILTFVLLENGADIASVNKKLTDVVLEVYPQTTTKFMLFPLVDIHLKSQFGYTETKGPVIAVYLFSLIALFVLLIACINFINLSTARASIRAKEIGVRKVSGAERRSIITQFMFESFLQVFISLIIAVLLIFLLLKTFSNISGKQFYIADIFRLKFIVTLITTGFLAGLISGIYPAFYLSSFKPATVLKGETVSGGNRRFRQFLVVLQFSLSIIITIVSVFMYMQLKHLQNKELGYNKENVLTIPMTQNMKDKYYSLKKELLNESVVEGVSASTSSPVLIGSNSGGAWWEGKDPEKSVLIGTNAIDFDYVKTMKIQLASGRDFSVDYPGDMARDTLGNFLVNEEVARIMGSGDPVGKPFRFMGLKGTIVGVLKNFYFREADKPVGPVAFALTGTEPLNFIIIRLRGDIPDGLKVVEKTWNRIIPEYPLDYTFIDQDYDNLFKPQIRLSGLLKYFTILTVIIACLGLYGLSAYSAERRTNEVGIRKVMGAGSGTIIYSMSREFIILVLISILIAVPAGWFMVNKLLEDFSYRIELNYIVFAAISAGAVTIAFLTVSFQAYRAAGINPANALKLIK